MAKDASDTFHASSCAVTSLRALADVVGWVLGWHGGEHVVTKIVQRTRTVQRGTGDGAAQARGSLVEVLFPGVDQPHRYRERAGFPQEG